MMQKSVQKESITIFQKYCEKAINQLTDDVIKTFKEATCDQDRIQIIYNYAKTIPLKFVENGKNFKFAQKEKIQGNKFFILKQYDQAINCYNNGIIKCPQITDENKELLCILISNRSACFFEQQNYRKVFDDIDYILSIGNYPQKLFYKIWLRKAKCYEALQNQKYAEEAYNLALSSLKHAELSEVNLLNKVEEIKNYQNKVHKFEKVTQVEPILNSDLFSGGNKEFSAAHKNIYFDFDPLLGRYARAVDHIDTGTIIIEEKPHCVVISSENSLTNCQYCCVSANQPVACSQCGHVIFCSLNCKREADANFHNLECQLQPILFESGASINCLMALRMISQKPLNFFIKRRGQLKDYLKDECKKNRIKNSLYSSDDYITAFFLCRNEHLRNKGELVHYSIMAIFLLRLLKKGKYFENNLNDDILSVDEIFIGSLLLRHLQILQFNSHEVSELRQHNSDTSVAGIEIRYKNEFIGAGLYPTLALFNHSCDPSIVRYNVGNKMIVRTIKPIKSGEIVYENYGPIYTSACMKERKAFLKERYWFDCYCTPCQEEWPLFENMDSNQIKLGCQTKNCPFEFVLYKDDFVPYLQCDYCNSITKVFPHLKSLSELAILLPRAENFYALGNNREAMKLFIQSLEILYGNCKPPCPDMVKIQQRLRSLLVHFGNRSCNYKCYDNINFK